MQFIILIDILTQEKHGKLFENCKNCAKNILILEVKKQFLKIQA